MAKRLTQTPSHEVFVYEDGFERKIGTGYRNIRGELIIRIDGQYDRDEVDFGAEIHFRLTQGESGP